MQRGDHQRAACGKAVSSAWRIHGMARIKAGDRLVHDQNIAARRQWRGPAWRGRIRRPTRWWPAVRARSTRSQVSSARAMAGCKLPAASRRRPADAASGPAPPAAPPRAAIPDADFAADRRGAPPACWRGIAASVLPSRLTSPRIGLDQSRQRRQQGGFARAIGPDHGDEFARPGLERDIVAEWRARPAHVDMSRPRARSWRDLAQAHHQPEEERRAEQAGEDAQLQFRAQMDQPRGDIGDRAAAARRASVAGNRTRLG